MMLAALVWGAPQWLAPLSILTLVFMAALVWVYSQSPGAPAIRFLCGLLKTMGIVALALCILEPLFSGVRPRPGANLFVMLVDDSQSLKIHDSKSKESRGELLQKQLVSDSPWQTRLGQDFDIRRYSFDERLRAISDFSELSMTGSSSAIMASLTTIAQRYRTRPVAGVFLATDGNATDTRGDRFDFDSLPPVYPLLIGSGLPAKDISVRQVTMSQTNFEEAPVTIQAEISSRGYQGRNIIAQLLDDSGEEVEKRILKVEEADKLLNVRYQLRPKKTGVNFYSVRAMGEEEQEQFEMPESTHEATLLNNTRDVVVDRGKGPYRVLYVSGRPNWEYKFMRRALEEDSQVDLVGFLRIARREPKFKYRSRAGESSNPLFRGFEDQDKESTEQYDQPVLMRLDTVDQDELRDGFPKTAESLYRYHAVILDDVEAGFFTPDQMMLLEKFVSRRGGGFLMLGGVESFQQGKYDRTPIGELLPVYLDDSLKEQPSRNYRLSLTREGWLQPWVRLRKTEQGENQRLADMPDFRTYNRVRGVKPGASVLAEVSNDQGDLLPALVEHRFGRGRAAVMMIGDLWKWSLKRKSDDQRDLEKAWRQTVRWLVADVPGRVETGIQRKMNEPSAPIELLTHVYNDQFQPQDNAVVKVKITSPDGKSLDLESEPSQKEAGAYVLDYVPHQSGSYRAMVTVTAADGSEMKKQEVGWTAQPAADEFRFLEPNRELLQDIADRTGGEVLELSQLDEFVTDLPQKKIPITEPWIYPLWHHPFLFAFIILCLTGEWGIRRLKGLA